MPSSGGVYSERFVFVSGANTGTYTVPSGYRAVVKYVSVGNAGSTAKNASLSVAGKQFWVASVPGLGGLAAAMMVVVYQAEVLSLFLADTNLVGMASGFLLAT